METIVSGPTGLIHLAVSVVALITGLFVLTTTKDFFIVTELAGKKLQELEQRILFISTGDLKTGRRYIKGLEKIEVRQVE